MGILSASASQVQAGYVQVVAALHAAGLKVAGGTLTPSLAPLGVPPLNSPLYAASGPIALNFGSLATDSTRQQINTYILTSGLFDRTIDFAAAVTDPLTGMLRAPYLPNSQGSAGDYLHPNRAGYQAMGLAAANIMSSMLAN